MVNIFTGHVQHRSNRVARELHQVSLLNVWCWLGPPMFPKGKCDSQNSH